MTTKNRLPAAAAGAVLFFLASRSAMADMPFKELAPLRGAPILVIPIVNLLVEILAVLPIKKVREHPGAVIGSLALVNVLTLPFLCLTLPSLLSVENVMAAALMLLCETLIILIESYFVFLLNRKRLKLGKAFHICLTANAASFALGILLHFVLTTFLVLRP